MPKRTPDKRDSGYQRSWQIQRTQNSYHKKTNCASKKPQKNRSTIYKILKNELSYVSNKLVKKEQNEST